MKRLPRLIAFLLITTTYSIDLNNNTNDETTFTTSHLRRLLSRIIDPKTTTKKVIESFSGEGKKIYESDYDFFLNIHKSQFPVKGAGEWVYREDLAKKPSREHFRCLYWFREQGHVEGNCHDSIDKGNPKKDEVKRLKLIEDNKIGNSPGILDGKDPWVWESNLDEYKAIIESDPDKYRQRIRSILSGRTIHLIGDSLTRQWFLVFLCELIHVHGMSEKEARKHVKLYNTFGPPIDKPDYGWFGLGPDTRPNDLRNAAKNDIIVINLGHHFGPKQYGEIWPEAYEKAILKMTAFDFGKVPDENIYFRTTTVRHAVTGKSDTVGNSELDMNVQWETYGFQQPQQNLIALEVLKNKVKRKIQILDTAPMMLARCDASYDGSHFCTPGPIEYWTKMLCYQIELRAHYEIDVEV